MFFVVVATRLFQTFCTVGIRVLLIRGRPPDMVHSAFRGTADLEIRQSFFSDCSLLSLA
jgi:hypothetical protein